MIKKTSISMALGCVMALGVTAASANDPFAALVGVDAKPLNTEQLAAVEGSAHTTFALGSLVFNNTNGRIASKPAWAENHGLHPSRALSKAQVGKK